MASPARDLRYIAGMFAETFIAVIFANFLTVGIFYGAWRLHRNERDKPAMLIVLFCSFFIVAGGLALREQKLEQTTAQAHSE